MTDAERDEVNETIKAIKRLKRAANKAERKAADARLKLVFAAADDELTPAAGEPSKALDKSDDSSIDDLSSFCLIT